MTKPFTATYADMKIIKTRQVVQVVLEAPLETMPEIVSYLGAPNPASETWVAIAKLNIDAKAENLPVQHRKDDFIGHDSQTTQTTLKTQKNSKPYGRHAKKLILSGFFKHLEVWQEISSEAEYFEWLREQPSIVSKQTPCVVAHVRRVSRGAGMGIKPPYFAVPLTHEEHQIQHQHGESALMPDNKYHPERFEQKAFEYLETYMRNKFKHDLGYDSLANIPPDVILNWCEVRNLSKFLPTCYKG